ncbi:MAG: SMP-30/gluconolactonase/LRE family protein, partial [Microlunatus sp.]|nr:SMP-30/gluconolactonase/LRE family protein [Microlunatus sp.]
MRTRVLLDGLLIGESARWHDGRLWLANWGTGRILTVDDDGRTEVQAAVDPAVVPISIDWLPDGTLLVVAGSQARLLRQETDGSLVDHVGLELLPGGLNEIVVDRRGVIFVNGGNEFDPDSGRASGFIASIDQSGTVRVVAEGIAFPNGMVVTSDGRTLIIAESFAARLTAFDIDGSSLINRRTWAAVPADGISIDAADGIWTPTMIGNDP